MKKLDNFAAWILCYVLTMGNCIKDQMYENMSNINYVIRVSSVYACSGVVIDFHWVLTAAQCMGSAKIAHVGENDENMLDSEQVIMHPDYKTAIEPGTVWVGANDLALIKIEDNLSEIFPKIKPIQLSTIEWPQDGTTYNRKCLAAGYGEHKGLQSESGIWYDAGHGEKACACISKNTNPFIVCMNNTKHTFCTDDFGGALVCDNKLTGILHTVFNLNNCNVKDLFGIKAECDNPESISISMYVCPYLDWIHQNVQSTPTRPQSCHATTIFNQYNKFIIIFIMALLYII